ncbi:ATP-binding protein [Prosthecobacter sp.]|uniref:ATP-binding protein n=1 Tax=Prosthecobacter sp. TaxID=1965333 RepID=UPI0037830A53
MSSSPSFDPRKLMELAVEVMRQSVNEPRTDGAVSPKVGAVLWKPDGTIDAAARGELRYGDHAEFTVLERKNRSSRLDGSILFATLEPCAPGARSHPKLSCAERIVNARIKEVYVGIQDPHPKVAGHGFKFLEQHGVTVHMFDRDLQEIIQGENAAFLDLAERAAEQHPAREDIFLSEHEKPAANVMLTGLSAEALLRYQKFIGLGEHESDVFHQRLCRQGLLESTSQGGFHPTGFGVLLFGSHPRDSIPEAGLLATIHYDNGQEELRDFDGPMVLIPGQLFQWLQDKLPNPIDRSQPRREVANKVLFELIREGVVNALVHRDYGIKGAKCQLLVTPDAVVIKSPGAPVEPITLAQLQSFTAPMISRNPRLHAVFSKMELAEERGLGLKSMQTRAVQAGLPLPAFTWEAPYLVLTLYRSGGSAVRSLPGAVLAELSDEELKGWEFLASRVSTTQAEYSHALGAVARTAQRHLKHFVQLGLLQRIGAGPATKYVVRRDGMS